MNKLGSKFFHGNDVTKIARKLLGKVIVSNMNGQVTSGRIVETEAYVGLVDRASHSFGGKRTSRNEHMYWKGGTVYVYICYGIHHMLNIVTNKKEIPDAILVRAIEPILGIDIMMQRTMKAKFDQTLTRGPGNVAKALGISKAQSGAMITGDDIYVYEDDYSYLPENTIGESKRIGIESAGEDRLLPYRYYIKENKFVSGRPVK